jgi:hypothetical protein
MWQIYEGKVIALTRGGLTGRCKRNVKSVVTTNCEKSAEAIVPGEEVCKKGEARAGGYLPRSRKADT